jgi:hypothetical protein
MSSRPAHTIDMIDADTRAAIARAEKFSCTILSDRRYVTFYFPTVAEARAFRPKLEAAVSNHRKAIVYACTPDGLTFFVPDNF